MQLNEKLKIIDIIRQMGGFDIDFGISFIDILKLYVCVVFIIYIVNFEVY